MYEQVRGVSAGVSIAVEELIKRVSDLGLRVRRLEKELRELQYHSDEERPEWVRIADVQRSARVSRRTVYNWIEKDLVVIKRTPSGSVRIKDKSWLMPPDSVKARIPKPIRMRREHDDSRTATGYPRSS